MNYSIIKHAFENGHFRGYGGGTCYSPPRRIAPKPSVSGIVHGLIWPILLANIIMHKFFYNGTSSGQAIFYSLQTNRSIFSVIQT